MSAHRTRLRRHRRTLKQVLRYGPKAKARHKLISGRTGRQRPKGEHQR